MKTENRFVRSIPEQDIFTEDLAGNLVIDFGSNMAILGHSDVKGLRVKREHLTGDMVIDLFVYRLTNSLRLLIQEEYGDYRVRFHFVGFESSRSAVPFVGPSSI